jgi:hypothetical protein
MVDLEEKPDTARLLGALIRRIYPDDVVIYLSREEIASAPEVEMKELFDLGIVELRAH